MLALLAFALASPHGHAMKVSHEHEGVIVPDSPVLNPPGDFTIEAWVKPEPDPVPTGPFHFIVSKNYAGGYALLMVGGADDYRFQFEAGEIVAYSIPMSTMKNAWWHLAGVLKRNAFVALYVNGVKVAEKPAKQPFENRGMPLSIGTSPWDSFFGQVDDVQIWGEARTQAQILEDKSHHLSGREPGLIGYWDFERIRHGLVYDRTHHTKPGKVTGHPAFDHVGV
jgi:hypothetical protein